MTRITSHVLAVGLLATALDGCGKSWPPPKAGAHAPTTPYQATQSATPRPAGETLPFTFHSEIQLGEVFASELQWVGPGYVYAHLRKLPDGSKSAGTIVFDPTRRVMLWIHEGQENEMSEW